MAKLEGVDNIEFSEATVNNLTVTGTLDFTDLVYSSPGSIIRANTSDSSDTSNLILTGGGNSGNSRGGSIELYGNEYASIGGDVILRMGAAGDGIRFVGSAGNDRVLIDQSGDIRFTSGTPTGRLLTNTTDGDDDGAIIIAGGGDFSSVRGSRLEVYGNEHSSEPGNIRILTGADPSNDASDNQIEFYTGNGGSLALAWRISGGDQDLLPGSADSYNLGSSSARINTVYANTFHNALSANLDINQVGSLPIRFLTSSTLRASINSVGISPGANNTYNLGSSGARFASLWLTSGQQTFTGNHVYQKDSQVELKLGDAVCLNSSMRIEPCTSASGTTCVGIYTGQQTVSSGTEVDSTGEMSTSGSVLYSVAAVGDSVVAGLSGFTICNENGDLSAGDLLCTSSTSGCLMRQDGTDKHSYTVGKCMENITFGANTVVSGIYGFIYCG